MLKFVLKRILWIIPVTFGVMFIVFTISYFTPGDPVISILGTNYTQEMYDAKVIELGLDRGFFEQFFSYIWGVVSRFDLGTSYSYKSSVSEEILFRMGPTLKLGVCSVILTAVIGIPMGILSATKQYSPLDYGVTTLSMILASVPNYVLALLMILLFAVKLGWLPVSGLTSWKHWILPILSNALTSVAVVARMSRSSMLEVVRQDYIRTARAKGLGERAVIFRHALKNALMPIITVVGMQLSIVIGGSVIIEAIFSIPGMGSYLMTAINNRDYPVINGCVLVISLAVCIMNLLVDVAYAFIDPRVKAQYVNKKEKNIIHKTKEQSI